VALQTHWTFPVARRLCQDPSVADVNRKDEVRVVRILWWEDNWMQFGRIF